MRTNSDEVISSVDRIHDIPRIEAALKLAVREALLHHKRAGNPIAIWRNGKVEWIEPEDILIEEDPPSYEIHDSDSP